MSTQTVQVRVSNLTGPDRSKFIGDIQGIYREAYQGLTGDVLTVLIGMKQSPHGVVARATASLHTLGSSATADLIHPAVCANDGSSLLEREKLLPSDGKTRTRQCPTCGDWFGQTNPPDGPWLPVDMTAPAPREVG